MEQGSPGSQQRDKLGPNRFCVRVWKTWFVFTQSCCITIYMSYMCIFNLCEFCGKSWSPNWNNSFFYIVEYSGKYGQFPSGKRNLFQKYIFWNSLAYNFKCLTNVSVFFYQQYRVAERCKNYVSKVYFVVRGEVVLKKQALKLMNCDKWSVTYH